MGANNKNAVLATNQKVTEGVDTHFAKVKTLTLAGVSYTPATLKAALAAETNAIKAVDQARAQMKEQVATARAAATKASAARKGLRAYVLGTYGAQAVQVLEDFGMVPPKTTGPKRTALVKATAAARANATREARHTMGKRQRLSVKGEPVTLAVQTPAEASPAPAAPVAAPAEASTAPQAAAAAAAPSGAPAHS